MGYHSLADAADQGHPLETVLAFHFSSNCFPPVPSVMIPVAVAAIEAYEDEDLGRLIALPDGVEYRHAVEPTALEVIESLHLEALL